MLGNFLFNCRGTGNSHGMSELEEQQKCQNRFSSVLLFPWELERPRSRRGIVLLQEENAGQLRQLLPGRRTGAKKSLFSLTLLSHLKNGYGTSIIFLVARNK